jgi:hypothetical protein
LRRASARARLALAVMLALLFAAVWLRDARV